MMQYTMDREDYERADRYMASFNTSYRSATSLLPKDIQQATVIFYAFVRYADELVDNPETVSPLVSHTSFDAFHKEWNEVSSTEPTEHSHPFIRSLFYVMKEYAIPFSYIDDFLRVMKQDTLVTRYHTYEELEAYMWGSASVVGLIMAHIFGYREHEETFPSAQALAEAMQLTNFLRDVDEDYQERNRIYLPQQDQYVFGVSESMIASRTMTPELRNLIQHYAERTEELYRRGIAGITFLKRGRFAVLYSANLYHTYLTILTKRNYDLFQKKITLPWYTKGRILLKTVMMYGTSFRNNA